MKHVLVRYVPYFVIGLAINCIGYFSGTPVWLLLALFLLGLGACLYAQIQSQPTDAELQRIVDKAVAEAAEATKE
jgi:hypothetical protein